MNMFFKIDLVILEEPFIKSKIIRIIKKGKKVKYN